MRVTLCRVRIVCTNYQCTNEFLFYTIYTHISIPIASTVQEHYCLLNVHEGCVTHSVYNPLYYVIKVETSGSDPYNTGPPPPSLELYGYFVLIRVKKSIEQLICTRQCQVI